MTSSIDPELWLLVHGGADAVLREDAPIPGHVMALIAEDATPPIKVAEAMISMGALMDSGGPEQPTVTKISEPYYRDEMPGEVLVRMLAPLMDVAPWEPTQVESRIGDLLMPLAFNPSTPAETLRELHRHATGSGLIRFARTQLALLANPSLPRDIRDEIRDHILRGYVGDADRAYQQEYDAQHGDYYDDDVPRPEPWIWNVLPGRTENLATGRLSLEPDFAHWSEALKFQAAAALRREGYFWTTGWLHPRRASARVTRKGRVEYSGEDDGITVLGSASGYRAERVSWRYPKTMSAFDWVLNTQLVLDTAVSAAEQKREDERGA